VTERPSSRSHLQGKARVMLKNLSEEIRGCHRHAVGLCAEGCCSSSDITIANHLFRLRLMQINVSRRHFGSAGK